MAVLTVSSPRRCCGVRSCHHQQPALDTTACSTQHTCISLHYPDPHDTLSSRQWTHPPGTLLYPPTTFCSTGRCKDTLSTLVTHIMEHPLADGPVPDRFVDHNTYRLFYQFHLTLTDLGRATLRLTRARRLLQFIPGPPGLSGQYRMDPAAHFPPHTTDFLSTEPITSPSFSTSPHRRSRSPSSFVLHTAPSSATERSRSTDARNYTQLAADVAALPPAADRQSTPDATRVSHLSNHEANTAP